MEIGRLVVIIKVNKEEKKMEEKYHKRLTGLKNYLGMTAGFVIAGGAAGMLSEMIRTPERTFAYGILLGGSIMGYYNFGKLISAGINASEELKQYEQNTENNKRIITAELNHRNSLKENSSEYESISDLEKSIKTELKEDQNWMKKILKNTLEEI